MVLVFLPRFANTVYSEEGNTLLFLDEISPAMYNADVSQTLTSSILITHLVSICDTNINNFRRLKSN
ncbi:hypothetical protein IFVP203_C2190042 [Vibrio parahaemolyticus]